MTHRPDQCAVVFDWNGTLLNDARLIFDATNKVVECLGAKPVTMPHYQKSYILPLDKLYIRLGCDEQSFIEKQDLVFGVWAEHYNRHVPNMHLRRGAKGLLKSIREKNHRSTILSNHTVESIESQTKRLAIRHFFDDILANNPDEYRENMRVSDKGSRLKHYVNRHDIRKALVVGDSAEEIEIAHVHGFLGVGITGGCVAEERIRAAKPDFMIRSLTEMPEIVRKVFSRRGG